MKTQNKVNLIKNLKKIFGIFNVSKLFISKLSIHNSSIRKLSVSNIKQKLTNRWHLSAEGFLLLPSALRPHLLGVLGIIAASTIFSYLCSTPVSAASLTLTIPSSFSLDITPGANGVFSKSGEQTINVKTDNITGYTLSIKAKNNDNSNSLINSSNSINNKLNSISESTTEDLFKSDSKFNNSWGYLPSKFNNEDNTNFLPGPTSKEAILETTENANNESGNNYGITLGAKVDNAILSGNYSNDFVFSVMANESKIKYMQDFTSDDCAALIQDDGNNKEDIAITLTDKRDGNEYKVGKLADGKCWMLQGLRIMDKNISSADSDMVDSDGTFKIPASDISKFVSSDNNNNAAYYYEDNKDDNGYYTWYTATAGSGTTDITSSDALSSICPKGWRMPRSGPGGSNTSELVTLIKAYGGSGNDGTGQQDIIDNIVKPSFPNYGYAGSINYSNGVLTDFGKIGYYWSSTAYSSGDAYGIYYNNSNTNLKPGDHGAKRRGRPVRCVAGNEPRVTMTYHLNSGTGGPTSPSIQRSFNSEVMLGAKIPTRDSYDFVGWCDQYTTSSSCPGKLTKPGKTYEINGRSDLNFYAVWKLSSEVSDRGFLGTMQDFDCSSQLPYYHQYGTVKDSRDGSTYSVARLGGGKCWMTQNLRLINKTITPTDSDMTSGSFNIPSSTNSGWSSSNYTNPMAYYGNNTNYGALYTWLTATAGTGTASLSSGEAPSSICPKGWRLPTYAEMRTLTSNYSVSQAQTSPLNFGSSSWAGDCSQNGCPGGQGSVGYWWSSTANGGDYAYDFRSSSGNFFTNYLNKSYGISVRCVGRE